MKRTVYNGTLRLSDVGKEVTLIGWVAKRRNLGSLVFIDLRDHTGIVQITFDETMADKIKDVRTEYILQVSGIVAKKGVPNPKLETGEVEVLVKDVKIINRAETTPIIVSDDADTLEDTKLKYRYLDLRTPRLQKILRMRNKVTWVARQYLNGEGFTEIETPILSNPTPEGARDYLVPSRLNPGSFYALPQSPQIYKQLCMVAGFEKYFQIARCFRDEDLRSDRQPEFTQIDIEMSFIEEEDIWGVVENLMKRIFKEIKNVDLEEHFVRIPYDTCMEKYGSDKPDLRFDMPCTDVSSVFANTGFEAFRNILADKGIINALKVEGKAGEYSRKKIEELEREAKSFGCKRLSYLKLENGMYSGNVAKVVSDAEKDALTKVLDVHDGDIVFLIADEKRVAQTSLGAVRKKAARDLNMIKPGYKFLWVTDFPMFEYSKEENRYVAAHHPFTAPNAEDVDKLMTDPEHCYSRAYDLVLNGYELLSGSIRIHDQDLQEKVFEAIGMTKEEAYEKFGFFIDAFRYGTPPHGGVGIGLERLVMILADTENIRDVVAFPKTNSASELMSGSPHPVPLKSLSDLHIEVSKEN
ncbi:MAG: aspartate--tRNA ligase [Erysipelotrichales bacterium]|nr:aspartate--tRNA ligase [Erysipelotrichales bacterium]